MKLKLTVYTDETMTQVKKTCEADRLKIPYRVTMEVAKSLDNVNLDNTDDVVGMIAKNAEQVDKIVKATFGVSNTELECIDAMELIDTGKEIYKWAIEKMHSLKRDTLGKNGMVAAEKM